VTGPGGPGGLPASMVTVRRATLADAPAMGRVHVRAWQAAYRGQMPDAYLDGLRPEDREAHWEGTLAGDHLRGTILVAGASRSGEVFGVAISEVRYRRRSTSEESSSATPPGTL
jgi:hypothetical protein